MRNGERDRLTDRIRHIRRLVGPSAPEAAGAAPGLDPTRVAALEERIAHLEQLLEGLQDSVHRESTRQDKRIAELEAQIQPAAIGAALTKDARERGL